MAWLVLIISGALEAVWAVSLGKSQGFTKLVPTTIFLLAVAASMIGLSYALRSLPTGTAYAVWVGIGASLTVAYGMWTGDEPVSLAKILFLVGLISCIAGLKLTH